MNIHTALEYSWSILSTIYRLYDSTTTRRKQLRILVDRCDVLIKEIASCLEGTSDLLNHMKDEIKCLEGAFESVRDTLEILNDKGFIWCLVNADKIDGKVLGCENDLEAAFRKFRILAIFDRVKFQEDMMRARQNDQTEISQRLQSLSEGNTRILKAIQGQDQVQRRVEELAIAILKHVQSLPTQGNLRPEDAFLQRVASSIQRSTGRSQIELWVLSSLEVEFDTDKRVGGGSYGVVYKGEWNGATVAVKRMHVADAQVITSRQRKAINHEVKIWSSLRHPNVVTFYGACLDATVPFLVMEYCSFGDICLYLEKHPDANRTKLSYEVAVGLAYLHSKKIVHADVKGANVLIGNDHRALLTDFGLSLKLIEIRSKSTYSESLDRKRGTLLWMAPEVLEGASPDMAADVYSLGMTIWEIFSGMQPFEYVLNDEILIDVVVRRHVRPRCPARLSRDEVWDIVQKCWTADPTVRYTAKNIHQALKPFTDQASAKSDDELDLAISTEEDETGASSRITSMIISKVDQIALSSNARLAPTAISKTCSASRSKADEIASSMTGANTPRSSYELWSSILRVIPPQWNRVLWHSGNPNMYINSVTLLFVLTDKPYQYRVTKGDSNLGIRETYERNADGSQTINFLEYNSGYGIDDQTHIKVFAVDPQDRAETVVAEWCNPSSKPLADVQDSVWATTVREGGTRWNSDDTSFTMNSLVFLRVPTDKLYRFRVVSGDIDHVLPSPPLNPDGSLTINFMDCTDSYEGLSATMPIKVFVIQPDDEGKETLITGWGGIQRCGS